MTRECGAASAGEQRKSVGQAIEDLPHAEDSGSDRGELNGQRQTIEPAAQRDDRCLVRASELERARCRSRALTEQHDGFVLSQMIERFCSVSRRHLQRRNGDDVLAWHLERLAARRDHRQPGRSPKDLGHQRSHRSEKVFTVVEQEQQLPVLQVGEQDLQRLDAGLVSEVQGCKHGVGYEGAIANLGELDQPRAVRESPSEIGRNPKSEAGFPDTSWAHEAD
jgi:hypothetical protein